MSRARDGLALAAEEQDFVRFLAEGYKSNREAFSSFRCRFRIESGYAKSREDAIAGRLVRGKSPHPALSGWPARTTFSGLWLVKNNKVRFELACGEEPVTIVSADGTEGMRSGGSEAFLGSDDYGLNYSIDSAVVQLRGPNDDSRHVGPDLTPFTMGVMGSRERGNPYDVIVSNLDNVRYDGQETYDGRPADVVSVFRGEQLTPTRFAFDPARGYLPVRIEKPLSSSKDAKTDRVEVTKIIACSENRWFPGRSVRYEKREDLDGLYDVCIIETLDLDADNPPKDDEFALMLPAGTRLQHRTLIVGLTNDRTVSCGEIPGLLKWMHDLGEGRGRRHRAHEGTSTESPAGSYRWLIIALNILFAVAIGALFVRKRLRSRHG